MLFPRRGGMTLLVGRPVSSIGTPPGFRIQLARVAVPFSAAGELSYCKELEADWDSFCWWTDSGHRSSVLENEGSVLAEIPCSCRVGEIKG